MARWHDVLPGRFAMDVAAVVVASLAVWRVAHFLHSEDGPWDVAARLRRVVAARMFQCFFCVSVWPALPAAWLVAAGWREFALLWPALSAAAILIERAAFADTFVDIPEYNEAEEIHDVLRPDPTDYRRAPD